MTTKQILDSIYLIPVILDHLGNPTDITTKIIEENAIDIKEIAKIKALLYYHEEIVKNNFESNYPLLRLGLKEYGNIFLSKIFNQIDIINKKWEVLDYGSGAGQMSDFFLRSNPFSIITKLDKDIEPTSNQLRINFEDDITWYLPYKDKFDCIILSEVLHCKDIIGQQYLIHTSYEMLKPKGCLIIFENQDYCMAYRIGKIKNTEAKILEFQDISSLTYNFFDLKSLSTINYHTIYNYEKI